MVPNAVPVSAMAPAGASICACLLAHGQASAEVLPGGGGVGGRCCRDAAEEQRHQEALTLIFGGISVVTPLGVAASRWRFGGCLSAGHCPRCLVVRRPPDEKGWGPLFWSMPVGFTWAGWFAAWWCALEFYILLVQTNTLGRQALTYGSTECHLDLLMPWLNLTPNYYRSQDKLFTDGRSCCS